MGYCTNCGKEINDNAPVCVNCGAAQGTAQGASQNYYNPDNLNNPTYVQPAPEDKGGFLWGLLGCCIPIVGLVLFLVWKDTKPKTAKAAGMGALVSVIIAVIYYVLMIALGVGFGLMGM